jgi:hypothetical protein
MLKLISYRVFLCNKFEDPSSVGMTGFTYIHIKQILRFAQYWRGAVNTERSEVSV